MRRLRGPPFWEFLWTFPRILCWVSYLKHCVQRQEKISKILRIPTGEKIYPLYGVDARQEQDNGKGVEDGDEGCRQGIDYRPENGKKWQK